MGYLIKSTAGDYQKGSPDHSDWADYMLQS